MLFPSGSVFYLDRILEVMEYSDEGKYYYFMVQKVSRRKQFHIVIKKTYMDTFLKLPNID